MSVFLVLVLLLLAAAAAVLVVFRRDVARALREPVLRKPVLIIESDDWGFGPLEQAQRLDSIAASLQSFHDAFGRHPVMTLGVVLAGPDTSRIAALDPKQYVSLSLADEMFDGVRKAMRAGEHAGVFALHLHGGEHFWPPALLTSAQSDDAVARWLTGPAMPRTEDLPSHLQSRWTDASTLPSQPLREDAIERAVRDETALFERLFGAVPRVVVPPTFLWTLAVERAWMRCGIEHVVTPGARYEARDAEGKLSPAAATVHNGQSSSTGLHYVVRNDYFEPKLGHTAERAISALERNTRLGRPTLLETHRFNFLGDDRDVEHALTETTRLLERALTLMPDVAFMSTCELADQLAISSSLVETRWRARLHCVIERLREHSRLFKLACVTGLVVPAWLVWLCTRSTRGPALSTS